MNHRNHNFFIARTPLMPFGTSIDIKSVFEDQKAKEALLISSPLLYGELEKLLNGTLSEDKRENLEDTLYKFAVRMKSRCTPFGTFAGISQGEIKDSTRYIPGDIKAYKKVLRPDMGYIDKLYHRLKQDPAFRNSVLYYPNNTIYKVNSEIRYIECLMSGYERKYHLSKAELDPYLNEVIHTAKGGASLKELTACLQSDEILEEEAFDYVNELINASILINEFEPQVTNPDYSAEFLDKAAKFFPQAAILQNKIDQFETESLGDSIDTIDSIIQILKEIDPDYGDKGLIHVDLFKPCKTFSLSDKVLQELKKAIVFLNGVSKSSKVGTLEAFKKEFLNRYEEQMVPLSEVLDYDFGIGYPVNNSLNQGSTPLLKDLNFSSSSAGGEEFVLGQWEIFMTQKLEDALRRKSHEIHLTEEEVKRFYNESLEDIPDTFSTMFSVLGKSEQDIDEGKFKILHILTAGPTSTMLTGRFCHLDKNLENNVKAMLNDEQISFTDKVFAEIVHLPQGRAANILTRPALRSYEIPIFTPGSVESRKSIPLADLYVTVRNDKVILWSEKLQKQVIPRMSNAHAYSPVNAIPHYVFLCDVQYDYDHSDILWYWAHFNGFSFLPRLVFGKTIVKEARWKVNIENLGINEKTPLPVKIEKLKKYLELNNIPDKVLLKGNGDYQVLLQLDKEVCQRILLKEIINKREVFLIESLHTDENIWLEGEDGKYVSEFITTWERSTEKRGSDLTVKLKEGNSVKRKFLSGSEWFYSKIYAGTETSESILKGVISPLAMELLDQKRIDKWFFIRYADPAPHLRVRFHGKPEFQAVVMQELNKRLEPFLLLGNIWKVQTDTYIREIERYDELNIENSEDIFFHDSVAVTQLLALSGEDENSRWQLALLSLDRFLEDCALDIDQKIHLVTLLREGYLLEFNKNELDFKKQLGSKYRKLKNILTFIFDDSSQSDTVIAARKVLIDRSQAWQENIQYILDNAAYFSVSKQSLLSSYMHMMVNRFFKTKQRNHEMILFDLLAQYYRSVKARGLVETNGKVI